jgi:hypothetical protein
MKLLHKPQQKNMHLEMSHPLLGSTNKVICYNARFNLQTEQITAEYKVRALQFHPDKNEGNKEAEEKFQKLKVRIVYIT